MTVYECERQVLRLLDEVGAGDYAGRIRGLINEAQLVIATQWGFIRKKAAITCAPGETAALPADCYIVERCEGGTYHEEPVEADGAWRRGITCSGSDDGIYTITYKAYPDEVDDGSSAREIQLPPECHAALCAYAAALTQDNEHDKRAYQIFMGRYHEEMQAVERTKMLGGKARVISYGLV